MAMAKKEGWTTKTGSKWATMPDLMISYRAAAFWGRLYASDLLLGLQTQEEVIDIQQVTVKAEVPSLDDLNAKITKPVVTAEPDDDIF
jgi:hypothetical protein